MKEYRVKYWREDEDDREEYMEFNSLEQAQAFYDSLDGKAEIQKYVAENHNHEVVAYPTFDV